MRRAIILSGLTICLCAASWAQQPPPVVAIVGEQNITKEQLADEVAKVAGRDILNNLIQEKLVRQEMTRRRLTVPPESVEARMKAIQFDQRKRGVNTPGSPEAQRRGVELLLAIETMAKQDFRIHEQSPITNLKVAQWLRALRNQAKILGHHGGKLPKGVYASVNGEYISTEQFQEVLFLNAKPEDVTYAIERIVSRALVEQKIKETGMKLSQSDIDSELARMEKVMQRDPMNKKMTLAAFLQQSVGMSPHELRFDDNFRTRVAVRKFIRHEITPAEAKTFCEQHRALYGGGRVRASQILVAILDPRTRVPKSRAEQQEAFRKITEVYEKLKNGGDFAELAKQYSEDPDTKDKGGDLGFFTRYGQIREPMAGTAFLLRPGEMSGILRTPLGYRIIKTTDVEEPEYVDFENVKDQVINDMIDIRIPEWMSKLRRDGAVKILYK